MNPNNDKVSLLKGRSRGLWQRYRQAKSHALRDRLYAKIADLAIELDQLLRPQSLTTLT